nr:O-antigen ligase family protein [Candidatus Pseudothioglobus singularis]
MPLTVFGGNLIIVIICVLWLFSGNYKSKFDQIVNNKLMLASIVFFCIHLVGLLWTEDLAWGLHIVHKMWYFIGLFPILYTIVRKDYISHYISAFMLAISITEVCSYLVWFELIEPFKNATVRNPTPFMSHISYNPILAFAIYFVLHEIFFNKKITNLVFALYSFFAISMTINMFITGGRAGQVMFFAMLTIIIFQFFNTQKIKALFTILVLIPGIFFTAYQKSYLFQDRVDMAVKNITYYSDNKSSSVGQRITFSLNSWEVIKQNPIIGVGVGDFPIEYKKINKIKTPEVPNTTNPHNMYALVAMQLGALGIISMLSIFYYQIKLSFNSPNKFIRDVGITLPLLFLLIMWSDSYLLGHFTTLIFVFFSSFLYKDFEKF